MGNDLLALMVGAIVIVTVMTDVLWTTLTTQGSGPLTRSVTAVVERIAGLAFAASGARRLLLPAGPVAMVLLGIVWLTLLWLGWWLLFSAFPGSIVHGQSGAPAGLVERLYFVGFTLSTLGVGDFRPSGAVPMILTVVAAFNGLVLVTLIITYAVPLVQAVTTRRKLAYEVSLLGHNPQEIAWSAWQQGNRQAFEDELLAISAEVMECAEQRLAYPMLDLFYGKTACFSLGLQLVMLDEALSILAYGMQPNYRFRSLPVDKARAVVSHYIERVLASPTEAGAPPLPSMAILKKRNVPVMDNLSENYQLLTSRRTGLQALIRKEGWEWSIVEEGTRRGRTPAGL